jgi:hypothetical protein
MRTHVLVLAASFLCAGSALAQSSSPPIPGAVNPAVTPDNIMQTICVRGWTKTIRPPEDYTEALKHQQFDASGLRAQGLGLRDFEEDHLIPLELGGNPTDPSNIWLQPRTPADGWGADRKDDLEGALNALVCSGRLPLADAQQAIATGWQAAYVRFQADVQAYQAEHHYR